MFGGGGGENEALGELTQMMMPLPFHQDPKREERVGQWSEQETRVLIWIRAELEGDFTLSKRNKTLWQLVCGKMKERGYIRSPDQCKCKWKNLIIRYKGKETSDLDNGRQWPFFEEMQAVFTKRENNMHRLHLESEAGSVQAKNTVKRINTDHSYEALSEDEDEDDCESEEVTRSSNPRKRKVGKEKLSQMLAMEKPSKQPSIAYTNINNTTSLTTIQEMLRDFIQQQKIIDMEWRESIEKRAYARQLFEQEWHRSMEKLEQERMMIEQAWREREEQRRLRDESRAEKRDALLTDLLNRLIHEDHH